MNGDLRHTLAQVSRPAQTWRASHRSGEHGRQHGRCPGESAAGHPVGSSVDIQLQLSKAMGPIVGVGSVVRVAGANQMGIHLGRLRLPESQKLQDSLLPLIPD